MVGNIKLNFDYAVVLNSIQKTHNINDIVLLKMRNSPVFKLIASLPFYAGCNYQLELSILKVSIYLTAASNPDIFYQKPDKSIRSRIELVTSCPDGNISVIELITDFLEMVSINDHLEDYYDDLATGKPNPLFDQMGYYLNRKIELKENINSYPDQNLVKELIQICNPFTLAWWMY